MESAQKTFNFTALEEIRPNILKLQCSLIPLTQNKPTQHLDILDSLGRNLRASQNAVDNAKKLAEGYGDLVIVLIEPTNEAENQSYEKMCKASPTLRDLDATLRLASNGARTVEHTIVLDVRAFRSSGIRKTESREDQTRNDELAYAGFEEIMGLLHPRVVISCQCETAGAENEFVRSICSSTRRAAVLELLTLPNDHNCLVVRSFHPMYYARCEENPLRRVLREYLFEATFIIALNALAGYRIFGGIGSLHIFEQYGPLTWRVSQDGIVVQIVSDFPVTESDYASQELLEQMEQLEIQMRSAEKEHPNVSFVLDKYRRSEWASSKISPWPAQRVKEDILENLREKVENLRSEDLLQWKF